MKVEILAKVHDRFPVGDYWTLFQFQKISDASDAFVPEPKALYSAVVVTNEFAPNWALGQEVLITVEAHGS